MRRRAHRLHLRHSHDLLVLDIGGGFDHIYSPDFNGISEGQELVPVSPYDFPAFELT